MSSNFDKKALQSKPRMKEINLNDKTTKSLGTLLKFFIGLNLMIELKNGKIYNGILNDADDNMNLVLRYGMQNMSSDAIWRHESSGKSTSATGKGTSASASASASARSSLNDDAMLDYELVHIRGSSIRYIHFPDNTDLPKLVKLGLDRVKAAKDRYNRGKRTKKSSGT